MTRIWSPNFSIWTAQINPPTAQYGVRFHATPNMPYAAH